MGSATEKAWCPQWMEYGVCNKGSMGSAMEVGSMGSAVRNGGGMVPAMEGALGGMGPHVYTQQRELQLREHGVHTTEAAPRTPCAGQAWEVGGMECCGAAGAREDLLPPLTGLDHIS